MTLIQNKYLKLIFSFLCFLVILLTVKTGRPQVELILFENIVGIKGSLFIPIYRFFSAIGSMPFTGLLFILLGVILVYKKQYKPAFFYGVAFFAILAFAYTLKIGLALPRPNEALWLYHAKSFTFPSGHATRITFLMLTMHHFIPFQKRHLLLLAIPMILLVLLSRVYLGVHYPLDVVAGFFIGYMGSVFFDILKKL